MRGSPALAPREYAVLMELIEGQTTKQIADALHLQFATVRTYLQSLYRKTWTSTRAELVWWWAQHKEVLSPYQNKEATRARK